MLGLVSLIKLMRRILSVIVLLLRSVASSEFLNITMHLLFHLLISISVPLPWWRLLLNVRHTIHLIAALTALILLLSSSLKALIQSVLLIARITAVDRLSIVVLHLMLILLVLKVLLLHRQILL